MTETSVRQPNTNFQTPPFYLKKETTDALVAGITQGFHFSSKILGNEKGCAQFPQSMALFSAGSSFDRYNIFPLKKRSKALAAIEKSGNFSSDSTAGPVDLARSIFMGRIS